MDFATFAKITLIFDFILIGYGQAPLAEGSPCTLHDGSQGTCKNVRHCEPIKKALEMDRMTHDDIVKCLFDGDEYIACCHNEKRLPERVGTVRKAETACAMYSKIRASISWHIFGGIPTNLGEFPWMAGLGYRDINNDISFDCGGTLISDNFVLTAGHCVPKQRQPQFVRLGKVALLTDDDDVDPVDIEIQEIIRHSEYNSTFKKNDIALLRLAQPVIFTENVRPACLRTDLSDVAADVELTITGWGTITFEKTLKPSVLLKANVTSMPLQECNEKLIEYNRAANEAALRVGLSDSQYCAYDPEAKHDACQGDSGGPLQAFPDSSNIARVVGIVSFGAACGTNQPSIYVRVASYLDWIEPIVWPNL